MSLYYTYIVECFDGTFYTGKTNNLEKRLKQHNGLLSKGARYTKTRRPVVLKYFEEHIDNTTALQREYILKHLPRRQKEQLIKNSILT